MRRLPLVHAFFAALIDHALGIAQDNIVRLHSHGLHQFRTRDGGRAGAVDDQLRVLDVASGQVEGIDKSGRGDDCGAVLIIMKDRYIHQLP